MHQFYWFIETTLLMAKSIAKYMIFFGIFVLCSTTLGAYYLSAKDKPSKIDSIGLVELKGVITNSENVIKDLKYLEKNNAVKVIVLRVDSPGGVVGPSQEIHDEVTRIAKNKKIIVSMGSVAASGGYYVSAPATMIIANPGTLTGSIGVILKLTNIQKLLDKVGMEMISIKSGEMKGLSDPTEKLTPEKRMALQSIVNDSHEQFIKAVANGRKMKIDDVAKLATGQVYTGKQALAFGLVDKLGGQEFAIREAALLVGLKEDAPIIKPPKETKGLYEHLVSSRGESNMAKVVEFFGMKLLAE